jgi:hypothetical protein
MPSSIDLRISRPASVTGYPPVLSKMRRPICDSGTGPTQVENPGCPPSFGWDIGRGSLHDTTADALAGEAGRDLDVLQLQAEQRAIK